MSSIAASHLFIPAAAASEPASGGRLSIGASSSCQPTQMAACQHLICSKCSCKSPSSGHSISTIELARLVAATPPRRTGRARRRGSIPCVRRNVRPALLHRVPLVALVVSPSVAAHPARARFWRARQDLVLLGRQIRVGCSCPGKGLAVLGAAVVAGSHHAGTSLLTSGLRSMARK